MNASKLVIEETNDGSKTLFNEELNEHYHSTHGALTESRHVFLKHGLEYVSEQVKKIKILEVGFGTGLNAILTFQKSNKQDFEIDYHTLEPYPLPEQIIKSLGISHLLKLSEKNSSIFETMHGQFNKPLELSNRFSFTKWDKKLEDLDSINQANFNLVYFDAFAPEKQPELWTEDVFRKVNSVMKKEGVLVTYCVKGIVKRALKSVGFQIEKLPGPPGGKREMLRAIKV